MSMLRPTYLDIMNVVNEGSEDGEPIVKSRYSVVIAAAKRARQIVDGDELLIEEVGSKPLTEAIDEIYEGKVKILSDGDKN